MDRVLEQVLRPGQDIVVGQAFGTPNYLLEALTRHRRNLEGSRIFIGLVPDSFPELPGTAIETFFPSGPFASEAGQCDRNATYTCVTLHDLVDEFLSGRRRVNVVLGQGTPEQGGRHSLGVTVDFIHPAAERAQHVLLEVNGSMPWTGPRSTIAAASHVHAIMAPGGPASPPASNRPSDAVLAGNLLQWIPDGATLEFGIGQWFPPLVGVLAESRKGLRIHTGQIGSWIAQLIDNRALDDSAIMMGCGAAGPPEFYAFLDGNPRVQLAPATFTHDPCQLACLPCFRAINSVFEIDLHGCANSELSPAGLRGGIGGLPDFARGAVANPEGLSIVVLSSTAKGRSRIVPKVACAPPSLSSTEIDIVVTEVGSADLRGLAPGDRAEAIISVAAEEHRAALREAASAISI